MTSFFFFLKLIISIMFTILFHKIFTSVYIMLIFYAFKWQYCIHCKIWWNMFNYFDYELVFRITFTSINLFYLAFTICINNKWCFIRFSFFRCFISSDGVTTLQKYLFSYTVKVTQLNKVQICFLLQKNDGNLINKNH